MCGCGWNERQLHLKTSLTADEDEEDCDDDDDDDDDCDIMYLRPSSANNLPLSRGEHYVHAVCVFMMRSQLLVFPAGVVRRDDWSALKSFATFRKYDNTCLKPSDHKHFGI